MELQNFKETITNQIEHIGKNVYGIRGCLMDIDDEERRDRDASVNENFESFLGHITNDVAEIYHLSAEIHKFVVDPTPDGVAEDSEKEPVVSRLTFLTGVLISVSLDTLHNLCDVANIFGCHWESLDMENKPKLPTYNDSLENILDILGEALRVSEVILDYVNVCVPQSDKCVPKSCGLSPKGAY